MNNCERRSNTNRIANMVEALSISDGSIRYGSYLYILPFYFAGQIGEKDY